MCEGTTTIMSCGHARTDPSAPYILCPLLQLLHSTLETWTSLMCSRDRQKKSSLSMKSLLQKHSQIEKC